MGIFKTMCMREEVYFQNSQHRPPQSSRFVTIDALEV
jgi:hypothetical protein